MGLPPFLLQENVPLASWTTIGLGGPARFFFSATGVEELCQALAWARDEGLPVHILGGGSNTIFADEGYPGLVLHIALRGVEVHKAGEWVEVTAAAGEPWDELVRTCVEQGWGGVECLSGIPGQVGATPVQNVGAYGQEVAETLVFLVALDRQTLREVRFSGPECGFGYRRSRFKEEDRGRYVITSVTYRLAVEGRPAVRYAELRRYLEEHTDLAALGSGRPALLAVREAVLALRRSKSMLVDPDDPHSRSAGSFFLNPTLTPDRARRLEERWRALGGEEPLPFFPSAEGIRVPAAWLVEQAGFRRGYRHGHVGISAHHALALVNYGGTMGELLNLAEEIREAVYARFGLWLEVEPEIVEGGWQ